MEPPAAVRLAVLVAEVGGFGQRGQGLDHAAVYGGQDLVDIMLAHAARRGHLRPQFGDDRFEPLGIEDLTASDNDPNEVREQPTSPDLLEQAGLL